MANFPSFLRVNKTPRHQYSDFGIFFSASRNPAGPRLMVDLGAEFEGRHKLIPGSESYTPPKSTYRQAPSCKARSCKNKHRLSSWPQLSCLLRDLRDAPCHYTYTDLSKAKDTKTSVVSSNAKCLNGKPNKNGCWSSRRIIYSPYRRARLFGVQMPPPSLSRPPPPARSRVRSFAQVYTAYRLFVRRRGFSNKTAHGVVLRV